MSGIVGISSRRGFAVGALVRLARLATRAARAYDAAAGYLGSVRRRGGLPVAHAVPVAVAITAVLSWALITAAAAARPV